MKALLALPRLCATGLIRGYQYFISPLLGPRCRFYPSCSHYTMQAIERFGLVRGGMLSILRLSKCGPFHLGGYDPVPPTFSVFKMKANKEKADEPSTAKTR